MQWYQNEMKSFTLKTHKLIVNVNFKMPACYHIKYEIKLYRILNPKLY